MRQKNILTTKYSKVCLGITNQASGGLFLPFFDYDTSIDESHKIIWELVFLQSKYELSNIYLFQSTNGYNALSLDKLPFNILESIYKDAKLLCNDYKNLGLNRGFLTLRIGKDKLFVDSLKSDSHRYEKSLSHKYALESFYYIDIPIDNYFDSNTKLRIKAYRSEKNGFIEVGEFDL
jgi:hypothetical protein